MIRSIAVIFPVLCLSAGTLFADAPERTVSVDGIGHVIASPDMARLRLAVAERDADVRAAQGRAAVVTGRILEVFDRLGIDRKQVTSTGATVEPNYRWNRDTQEQELLGYTARRQIDVELLDLENLGEVVEGAVAAGANQVSAPVLDSTRRREHYRKALAVAAEDARNNALTLAEALGAQLGPALQINAGQQRPEPRRIRLAQESAMAVAEAAPETYNAGDIRFEASVGVVFELITE